MFIVCNSNANRRNARNDYILRRYPSHFPRLLCFSLFHFIFYSRSPIQSSLSYPSPRCHSLFSHSKKLTHLSCKLTFFLVPTADRDPFFFRPLQHGGRASLLDQSELYSEDRHRMVIGVLQTHGFYRFHWASGTVCDHVTAITTSKWSYVHCKGDSHTKLQFLPTLMHRRRLAW